MQCSVVSFVPRMSFLFLVIDLAHSQYLILYLTSFASSLGQCAESANPVWAATNYCHIHRRHVWGCCWDIRYELRDCFIWSTIRIPVDPCDHWRERRDYFLFVPLLFQVQKTNALVSSRLKRWEALPPNIVL